jgi:hypothetical protein
MKETAATEMYYTATCGYDFSQSTDSNGNIATSFSKIGNSCPENHYCRLTWTDKTWTGSTAPTGFANDYTGEMWGVCVPLASTTANAQPVYPSSNNLLVRKNMKCPENFWDDLDLFIAYRTALTYMSLFEIDNIGVVDDSNKIMQFFAYIISQDDIMDAMTGAMKNAGGLI